MAGSCGSWGWDSQNRPRLPRPYIIPVPSWEKTFCTSECRVPWAKICAAQAYLPGYENIAHWDDSAALEAFNNAKSRYYSSVNNIPCNIPLPDPYLYIDEVDDNTIIDPKLIEELEKEEPPIDTGNNKANGEGEATTENHLKIGWENYIEKPATNKWKLNDVWGVDNWDKGRNDSWGKWGDHTDNWGGGDNWGGDNWDKGINDSWGRWGNRTDNRGDTGNSAAWHNDRKRNGGYYSSNNNSASRHDNNFQGNCSSNLNMMEHSYGNSKARRFYGPDNNQRPSESAAFWYRRDR